jgi:hypothetical protein
LAMTWTHSWRSNDLERSTIQTVILRRTCPSVVSCFYIPFLSVFFLRTSKI